MCRKNLGEVINFITLLKSVEKLLTKVYKGGLGGGGGGDRKYPPGGINHS